MKKKGKGKKIIDWQNKAHREKIIITILISSIIILSLTFGYGIYDSFKTKEETEKKTNYLNSAVVLLNEEKSQLVLERDNFNQTVILLNQQATQLITEKGDLTSELSALQGDYDTCSADLQDVEDELDDCESACP